MSKKILLFGGTTEGRELACFLAGLNAQVRVQVATEYGRCLLSEALGESCANVRAEDGRMGEREMASLMESERFDAVLDATHPYALEVSRNIRAACESTGRKYLRVLRGGAEGKSCKGQMQAAPCREKIVADAGEAAAYLNESTLPVFLTTGSKDLPLYMEISDASRRIYARILPDAEGVARALGLGVRRSHLICMQGPFDTQMNIATIRQIQERIREEQGEEAGGLILVTKQSGSTGGFFEKYDAARMTGSELLVIGMPEQGEGVSLARAKSWLARLCGENAARKSEEKEQETGAGRRKIWLLGAGLSRQQLTDEAHAAIDSSDIIIGAGRVLRMIFGEMENKRELAPEEIFGDQTEREPVPCFEILHGGRPRRLIATYDGQWISDYLLGSRDYHSAAVLFSGDIGFYSGAKLLWHRLKKASPEKFEIRAISGISSAIHFLDALHKDWSDVRFLSLHGKDAAVCVRLANYHKLLVILGRRSDVSDLCQRLISCKMGGARVYVGADLSSENEFIGKGEPADFVGREFSALSLMYIEWDDSCDGYSEADARIAHGLPDEEFIRGKVPMTRSEVRSVLLSSLALPEDAVFYDIGAGTGSVSAEAARILPEGQVVAIERSPEGVSLIRANARKFHADNLRILEGEAPECLTPAERLPRPTHAFIGGAGGKMLQILQQLRRMNPHITAAADTVTLETTSELSSICRELEKSEGPDHFAYDVVQIQASRAKKAGSYRLMKAENPVYIFIMKFR